MNLVEFCFCCAGQLKKHDVFLFLRVLCHSTPTFVSFFKSSLALLRPSTLLFSLNSPKRPRLLLGPSVPAVFGPSRGFSNSLCRAHFGFHLRAFFYKSAERNSNRQIQRKKNSKFKKYSSFKTKTSHEQLINIAAARSLSKRVTRRSFSFFSFLQVRLDTHTSGTAAARAPGSRTLCSRSDAAFLSRYIDW